MFTKQPSTKFLDSITETKTLQTTIAGTQCPACTQTTLKLSKYVAGAKGWEAVFVCENCHFAGVVNSTGYSYERINSKGKARDKL